MYKQRTTAFLKLVVYLIGIIVAGLYVFGVASMGLHINTWYKGCILGSIIAIIIMTVIPFYYALFNTLKLLTYIDNDDAFSDLSVIALKNIRTCAIAVTALFASSMPFVYIWGDKADAPGVILVGLILTFSSSIIATFATILKKLLKEALDIKKDNELTI